MGFPVRSQTAVVRSELSKHLLLSGGETTPSQRNDVLSVVYQVFEDTDEQRKHTFTSLFPNLSKFTSTTVGEQVSAVEPDYPVRPAPPGGFQHFISYPETPHCQSLPAIHAQVTARYT